MSNTPIERWLDRVCAYLPAGHRRDAVRRELAAHLEDRLRVLHTQGLTDEAAEQQAVSNMGDPDELGRALAELYRPIRRFMGWLLTILLWGFILVLLVYVLLHVSGSL